MNSIVSQLVLIVTGKEKKMEQIKDRKHVTDIKSGYSSEKKEIMQPKEIKKKEIDPEKIIPFEEDEEFKQIH